MSRRRAHGGEAAAAGGLGAPAGGLGQSRRSLFTGQAALFVLAGPIVLMWPTLIQGGALLFWDSIVYINQGERIVSELVAMLAPRAADGGGGGGTPSLEAAAQGVESLRSVPYAAFVYLSSSTPAGLMGTIYVQGALSMAMIYAVVQPALRAARTLVAAVAAAMALLTPLPLHAALVMPDVLAGVVILYAVLLVRGFAAWTLPSQVALTLIALFATNSHHGHIPLAAGAIGAALIVLAARRGLGLQLAGLGAAAVVAAAAANALVGVVAFGEASIVPKRMPLMLARSIEDGPARWHIEEHCPEAGYVVCDLWSDGVPANITSVMWGETGLYQADVATQDRIRAEEPVILWRALREYPLRQLGSLFGNAAEQLVLVGTSDIAVAEIAPHPNGYRIIRYDPDDPYRPALETIGWMHLATYLAGVAALLVLACRPGAGARHERAAAFMLLIGLVLNAAVFGGLSVPVDRYGARVAWVAPLLALALLLERAAEARTAAGGGATAQREGGRFQDGVARRPLDE